MDTFRTGKLAHEAGVHIETIRYYERRGLIPEPERDRSGYRQYPADTLTRMKFIGHAKHMGFTLEEIRDLLDLCVNRGSSCLAVKEKAESKISEIDIKIKYLKEMKKSLEHIASQCSGNTAIADCSIVKALEE